MNLIPVSQPMEFLDKIVRQAFLKKLNTINQSEFKKFLMQRDKTADHHVDIVLEFKEEGLNNNDNR